MTTAAELFDDARRRLVAVAREGLGEERAPRWRAARIARVGEAWHLGVLLLTDDAVLATGDVLRAAEEVRRGYAAESARARAEQRARARKGGFGEGELVHVGWQVLDVAAVDRGEASGPLLLAEGVPSVRWSRGGEYVPLAGYLNERIALATG